MGYKEAPVEEVRVQHQATVDGLFAAFFRRHQACVARMLGGPVDLVLPVPSSSRPGQAPLDRVPDLGRRLSHWSAGTKSALWCPTLLERTGGPVGHMQANAHAFAVPAWAGPVVARARVLLIDDTYVSGARSQSAAAALRLAGATRVVIVPLGRVIRPDTLPEHAAFLERSRRSRAAPYRCARCVVTQREAAGWME
jgi:predicted amidophosphoribosyltransferase